MKKRRLVAGAMCALMATTLLAGCGKSDDKETTAAPATDTTASETDGGDDTTAAPTSGETVNINLWSFTDEIPNMVQKYIDNHPDCGFT